MWKNKKGVFFYVKLTNLIFHNYVTHICIIELGPTFVQTMACRFFGTKPLPTLTVDLIHPWDAFHYPKRP